MSDDLRRVARPAKRVEGGHKFRVGESVRLSRGRFPDRSGGGTYQIVRLLPETEGEFQYRIKAAGVDAERMVREGDIQRA
jgi:hypothetical protein